MLDLVERLADVGGEVSVNHLAELAGIPVPTTYRLLRLLMDRGYVRQGASGRYALGPHLIRLGEAASTALGTAAKPSLRKLATRTGETANMALMDGDEVVYIAQAQPSAGPAIRMFTEPGRRVHPHCTAMGKVLLARLPTDAVRATIKRRGLPALTPATITSEDVLLEELKLIRKRGYAVDQEEEELGLHCVAVAVPDVDIGIAIAVSGPAARLDAKTQKRLIPVLKAAAREFVSYYGPGEQTD